MDPRYGRWAETTWRSTCPGQRRRSRGPSRLRGCGTTNWSARSAPRAWARSVRSASRRDRETRSSMRPADGSQPADGRELVMDPAARGMSDVGPAGSASSAGRSGSPNDRHSRNHAGPARRCPSSPALGTALAVRSSFRPSRWRWRSVRAATGPSASSHRSSTFSLPLVVMIASGGRTFGRAPGCEAAGPAGRHSADRSAGAIVLTAPARSWPVVLDPGAVRSLTRSRPHPTFPATMPLAGLASSRRRDRRWSVRMAVAPSPGRRSIVVVIAWAIAIAAICRRQMASPAGRT